MTYIGAQFCFVYFYRTKGVAVISPLMQFQKIQWVSPNVLRVGHLSRQKLAKAQNSCHNWHSLYFPQKLAAVWQGSRLHQLVLALASSFGGIASIFKWQSFVLFHFYLVAACGDDSKSSLSAERAGVKWIWKFSDFQEALTLCRQWFGEEDLAFFLPGFWSVLLLSLA